jgi:predicted PurR-regulated permease PerM
MTRAFVIVACLVVILAGIKAAASLVVPFLLAVFLSILFAPPFLGMRRKGVPGAAAIIVMALGLGVFGVLTVTILKTSLDQFTAGLPVYEASLRSKLDAVWLWVESKGIDAPSEFVAENLDPRFAMSYVGSIARELSGMLGQAFLIFILVAFMLIEASGLDRKLRSILGGSDTTLDAVERNFQDVRRYISLKSVMSLLTGALVTLWLWILGIDNALFMGLLAFFLNFVPNIGSFIAAIPGVLLGFILVGPAMAAVTAVGYVVINVSVSNVIEPRVLGQSLGISPLVVIVSLVFWGWLLGPVGMLLSIPLTMAVKVGLEASEAARPIAVLLGPAPREETPREKE